MGVHREGMRFDLGVLALLAVAVAALACSPGGGSGPVVGGQTGDPGVVDFDSIDPGTPQQPGGGGVGGACPGVVGVAKPDWFGKQQRFQREKLDDAHVALFDEARGLAILDVAQVTPRLVARVPLPRSAGQLHVSGRSAFIVRRNVITGSLRFRSDGYPPVGDEAELLAIDLTDLTAPTIVERVALERAARTSMLTESGGVTRIHVLSDGGAADGCRGKDTAVHITSFTWAADHFGQPSKFTLGEDVRNGMVVAPLRDRWLLSRIDSAGSSMVSIVSVTPDGMIVEGQGIPGENPRAFHEDDGGIVRVLGTGLNVYDLSDPQQPKLKRSCTLGREFGGASALAWGPTQLFARSTLTDGTNYASSVTLKDDGSCAVRMDRGVGPRDIRPIGALAPARLLDVEGNQLGQLKVRLLDQSDFHVMSEVTIPGWRGSLESARALENGAGSELWLAVYERDATGKFTPSLRLLELSADSLRVRGSVASVAEVLPFESPHIFAWQVSLLVGERTLSGIDLSDPEQPRLKGTIDLAPRFSDLVPLDTHWARLRTPDAEYRTELSAEELFAARDKASLEFVPRDRDPDLGDETARIDANPFGRIVRVGSLLVSIAQGFKQNAQGVPPSERMPVPTLFEVFDVSDPEHPTRSGELRVDAVALARPCSYCTGSALDARHRRARGTGAAYVQGRRRAHAARARPERSRAAALGPGAHAGGRRARLRCLRRRVQRVLQLSQVRRRQPRSELGALLLSARRPREAERAAARGARQRPRSARRCA